MNDTYLERIAIALETLAAQGTPLIQQSESVVQIVEVEQPTTITEKQHNYAELREVLKSELLNAGRAGKKEEAREVMISMGYKKLSSIADSDLEQMITKIKNMG